MGLVERSVGRYRLLKELGRRGAEEVYEAVAEGLRFDLHFIPAAAGVVGDAVIGEAARVVSLRHVNIASVHEIAALGEGCFAAFERAGGGKTAFVTIEKLLADVREQRVPIPPPAALYIAREVASAVEYAHGRRDAANRLDPISHGPLRPSEIFVSTADGGVFLGDFGWARLLDQHPAGDDALSGAYLAPESLRPGEWDSPADLFAVGALLFELLALRHIAPGRPSAARAALGDFEPKPASAVRGKLPPMIDDIIMTALALQIADRPANALAFQRSLSKALYTVAPFYTGSDLARFLGGLADGSLRSEAAKHKGARREEKVARAAEEKPSVVAAPMSPPQPPPQPLPLPLPQPQPLPHPPSAVPTDRLPGIAAAVPVSTPSEPPVSEGPQGGMMLEADTSPAFRFPLSDATPVVPPSPIELVLPPPIVRSEPRPAPSDEFMEIQKTASWGKAPAVETRAEAGVGDAAPNGGFQPSASSERLFARSFDSASGPSFSSVGVGPDTDEIKLPRSGKKAAIIAVVVAVAGGGGFALWQVLSADKKLPPPPSARADGTGGDTARDVRPDEGPLGTARAGAADLQRGGDGGLWAGVDAGVAATGTARVARPSASEARRDVVARATAGEARRVAAGRVRREVRGEAVRRRVGEAPVAGGGTGYLTVKSDRWAYIFVDGGKKRQTPLNKLPLKAGSHTVKLHDPNEDLYKEFSVTITAGQTTVKAVYW